MSGIVLGAPALAWLRFRGTRRPRALGLAHLFALVGAVVGIAIVNSVQGTVQLFGLALTLAVSLFGALNIRQFSSSLTRLRERADARLERPHGQDPSGSRPSSGSPWIG